MKLFLTLLLSLFTTLSVAKAVGKIEQDKKQMILHDTPCQLAPLGFHAIYTDVGVSMKACWIERDDVVYLLFEDGDRGALPKDAVHWFTSV